MTDRVEWAKAVVDDLRTSLGALVDDELPYSALRLHLVALSEDLDRAIVIFSMADQPDCFFHWQDGLPMDLFDADDPASALDASLVVSAHLEERIGALGQPPLLGRPGVLVNA